MSTQVGEAPNGEMMEVDEDEFISARTFRIMHPKQYRDWSLKEADRW